MTLPLGSEPFDVDVSKNRLSIFAEEIELEINSGIRRLKFSKELEQIYQRDIAVIRKKQIIISLFAAILLINLFLFFDYTILKDVFSTAMIIRLGVISPFLLIVIRLIHKGLSPVWQDRAIVFATILTGFSIIFSLFYSQDPNRIFYHPALLLVVTFSNIIVRPGFWSALFSSIVVFIAYVVFYPHMQTLPPQIFVSNLTLLFFCLVITLDSNYLLEHEQRASFLYTLRERIRRTALDTQNRKLNRLVSLDPLTRLANRREVDEFIERMGVDPRPDLMAVIMFDIDHFKKFNDLYGHPAGDECLRTVAHELRKVIRRKGDLVGRIGGEEFIVLLPESDLPGAAKIAEIIRANIQNLALEHSGSPVGPFVSISAGVTAGKIRSQRDIRNLLESADEALYKAKENGRNRVETVVKGVLVL